MSVWFCIPSARPAAEAVSVLNEWKKAGYKIALLRQGENIHGADLSIPADKYLGWARSINVLAAEVLRVDPAANWIVSGGDDTLPDTNHPEHIAADCFQHFNGTFGVMQPTGDRWAGGSIDRICGSPWLGREFCKRMYGGRGPMYQEYMHMFGDEELHYVASKLGVLWQRRDLSHLHKHYFRTDKDGVNYSAKIPAHMVEWNGRRHWTESQGLFQARKFAGFPGHEPI